MTIQKLIDDGIISAPEERKVCVNTMPQRKAGAVKVKGGYKAQITRKDGSTFTASKRHPDRATAIASAQLWMEDIERQNAKFQERQKPWSWR